MVDNVVDVLNVKYVYPSGVVGIRNASLSVKKGERVGLLGPNGSGKTTLLLLINGLLKGFKGTIKVFGKEISKHNPYELRRRMGLVFQDPRDQLFSPTVWDDVAFAPIHLKIPKDEVNDMVKEILEELGIWHLRKRPSWRLSEGEKKKVALATVIVIRPELLLLDEPFANLDAEAVQELMGIFEKLNHQNQTTFLISSHALHFQTTGEFVERAYILNKNKEIKELIEK